MQYIEYYTAIKGNVDTWWLLLWRKAKVRLVKSSKNDAVRNKAFKKILEIRKGAIVRLLTNYSLCAAAMKTISDIFGKIPRNIEVFGINFKINRNLSNFVE